MTKFKVGDKVCAVDNYYGCTTLDKAWEGKITRIHENGEFDAVTTQGGDPGDVYKRYEYTKLASEHFEKVSSKKAKIKALESRIAELEAKVAALESAPTTPKTVPVTTDNIAVGDKIRVINADEIYGGFDLTNGQIYEVEDVDGGGDFYFTDDAGDTLIVYPDEFRYVEKVVSE